MRRLAGVEGQRATAVAPAGHRQPDWRAVAGDYDGVHLTWAGFLTTEGFVDVDDAGTVSLLRYWLSERTLWLHDVFGEPDAPARAHVRGPGRAELRRRRAGRSRTPGS